MKRARRRPLSLDGSVDHLDGLLSRLQGWLERARDFGTKSRDFLDAGLERLCDLCRDGLQLPHLVGGSAEV